MFIAMNRFRIALGRRGDVREALARSRFVSRRRAGLPRVPSAARALRRGGTLYASHTIWESRAAFEAWTESESFRKAHQQARAPAGTYLGHPRFEGFEVIL